MVILFEDYYLLVCNKPSGLSSEIQKHSYPSMEQQCLKYLQEKFPDRKNYYLRPVHRLDRAASGVMIFAKTYTALQNVNTQTQNKKITKKYLAIVEGVLKRKEDTLTHWLLKDNLQKKSIVVNPQTKNSKESILHYSVLHEYESTSLIIITLETGRYHQIRSQFAEINNPIVNDSLYNGKKISNESSIALHALSYSIHHPVSNQLLLFKAELPANDIWREINPEHIIV